MVFDFLDRDDAFAADLLHGVGDQLADRRIVVRRDRRDLRLLLAGRDRPRQGAAAPRSPRLAPRSRPRLMSMALAPATTLRTPSAKMACARIVDVLVPSPTMSPVFSAAWRSIRAPRFSSGSLRSNSLAMVTPSLQTIGAPISSRSAPTSIAAPA